MRTQSEIEALVIEAFRRVAKGTLGRELGELRGEVSIEELGVGSMALLEIIGDLERELGISFDDERLGAARTVGELVELTRSLT